jgi:hypothetical protein
MTPVSPPQPATPAREVPATIIVTSTGAAATAGAAPIVHRVELPIVVVRP